MKHLTKTILLFLLVLIVAFAVPTQAYAQGPDDDGKVVFGGTYRLESGETLNGDLAIFGGTATIEEGATVNGSIVVTGGTLVLNGEVDGDVTAVGGTVNVGSNAAVDGDIYSVGGAVNVSDEADVSGSIRSGTADNFEFDIPNRLSPVRPSLPFLNLDFSPIANFLWGIFRALALAALAMLIVLIIPLPTDRVTKAISVQPVMAGAIGLLSIIVIPGILLLLAITIIMIPISAIGILLLIVALLFGWIALGLEVGRRMAAMFKVVWTDPVAAGIGTLVISLVVALVGWIPCIGWIIAPILSIIGLGGVVLTRFGNRYYTPAPPTASAPAAAPAPYQVVTPQTSTLVSEPVEDPQPPETSFDEPIPGDREDRDPSI